MNKVYWSESCDPDEFGAEYIIIPVVLTNVISLLSGQN